MTIEESREWAEMEANIKRAAGSLEECAHCGKVTECVMACERLESGEKGEPLWACQDCVADLGLIAG